MTAARHAVVRPARPSWWAPLVQWRNWRLLVKLAAVLIVPALLAVALGVVQIQGDVARANSYADMQKLVKMRAELRSLLAALQMERTMSVEQLSDSGALPHSALREQTRRVDRAQAVVASTRNQEVSLTGVAANRYRDATGVLTRLPALRAQVASGRIDSWTAINDYSTIIKGLLNLNEALFSPLSVPQLSRSATTLYDLETVEEQIHLQHVILLQAVGQDRSMPPALTKALQDSGVRLQDGLAGFRTVATPGELSEYRRTVTGPAVNRRARAVSAVLAGSPGPDAQQNVSTSLPVSVEQWTHDSETTGMLVDMVGDGLTRTLRTTSAELQDQSSTRAGVASVTVFAGLLLALAIGLAVGRDLLRSLAVLRTTALDVAEHRLPAAVASMREGQVADTAIDVVPVHSTEEFGQLARAFDTVHAQAVRLAAEQAGLRGDLRNTLVNLSRRSQSLVDRLLLLMEQLERREEDPDQLASLFTLDHLATRMRRNNENMMILCGSSLVRSFNQRAALDTVLRGAVSEIERYQRVVVQPSPSVDVIGYAAGDLGRLVAELLDNATAFSPPHTQVIIGGTQVSDGSVLIEIQDEGIGMTESDLVMANQRVAAEATRDTPVSRQLGLSVVGRLAHRHGIAVSLNAQPDRRGLRVRVHIAATLVNAQVPSPAKQPGARAPQPTAAGVPGRPSGSRTDDGSTAVLPERVSGSRTGDGRTAPLPGRPNGGRTYGGKTAPLPRRTSGSPTDAGGTAPLPRRTAGGPADGGRAAPLPRRPLTGTAQGPASPAAEAAPRGSAGPQWFTEAGSATATGAPGTGNGVANGTGNGAAGSVPPAAAGKPASGPPGHAFSPGPPGSSYSPGSPGDRVPPANRPAPALPVRRPAGQAAQQPAEQPPHTQAGLPKRVPPTRTDPPTWSEPSRRSDPPPRAERPAERLPAEDDGTTGSGSAAGRAHSFLSSYQAGLRRARPDQIQNPSPTGRKKP
ncbi:nitrate- and nitrite sensing domain-containing protein [Streptomyces sp. NPDC006012]|uniref:sensor histidine kinase n=1 Tax=Streptomyces sp. NPDC006012 TaxID=3364739 RepID=UPI00368A55D1